MAFPMAASKESRLEKHNLLTLYDKLLKLLADIYGDDGHWSKHCRNIIVHLHNADPDGEKFRFPESLSREVFPEVDIDIAGLIRAHHHVTFLCDCVVTMLREERYQG